MKVCWLKSISRGVAHPQYYGFSYSDYRLAIDVFYPYPINWLIRWWRIFLGNVIMGLDWVGLFDTQDFEKVSWREFFRIKSH